MQMVVTLAYCLCFYDLLVSPESQDQGKSTGVTFQKSVESENCVPVHTISSLGQDCTGKTRFEKVPSGPSEEQSEGMETVDQVTSDQQFTDLEEKKQEDVAKVREHC